MEETNQINQTQSEECSPEIGKLALALSKAQGQMEAAAKNSANPFFKSRYADLAEVWDVIRKPLSENGLAIIQTTTGDGTNAVVVTRLVHESGQWIKGTLTLRPTKPDAQGMGSAITYARRYAIAAMVGVVQEDDDANEASKKQPQKTEVKVAITKTPAERVADGLSKLGFSDEHSQILKAAFSAPDLLSLLASAFRSKNLESAKNELMDRAAAAIDARKFESEAVNA